MNKKLYLSFNEYIYHGISRIRAITTDVFAVNDDPSLALIETMLSLTIN
jgi:hypothetical protein